VTIASERRDKNLLQKLWGEAPGILAWLVRGCLEWQRDGLQPPAAVQAATAQWREQSDEVAEFVGDVCMVAPSLSVGAGVIYREYVKWSEQQRGGSSDRPPLTNKAFGVRLGELGYQAGRTGTRGRFWSGLGLPAHADQDASEEADAGREGAAKALPRRDGNGSGWAAAEIERELKGWS